MRAGEDDPQGVLYSYIIKVIEDWPGGSYIVMKSTPIFPGGRTLLDIGYKYNSMKVLGFISTEGDRSNQSGDPYLSRFPGIFLMFLFVPFCILTC